MELASVLPGGLTGVTGNRARSGWAESEGEVSCSKGVAIRLLACASIAGSALLTVAVLGGPVGAALHPRR